MESQQHVFIFRMLMQESMSEFDTKAVESLLCEVPR